MLAALTLCAFAAWIGLLNSWRLARRLYLVCMAMSVFLALISSPMVVTSIGAAFRLMDGLVSGAVLAREARREGEEEDGGEDRRFHAASAHHSMLESDRDGAPAHLCMS